MSINRTSLQYLLTVAQKIIHSYADSYTITKYYALKDQLTKKSKLIPEGDERYTLSSLDKENCRSTTKVRKSMTYYGGFGDVRGDNRETKKGSMKGSRKGSRLRFDTFAEQGLKQSKKQESNTKQNDILCQLALILKNAEQCPSVLKKVRFSYEKHDAKLDTTVRDIVLSLSNIYQTIAVPLLPSDKKPQPEPVEVKVDPDFDELFSDNRWLIEKLEVLIGENTVLRRMVGHKV